jgi:N-acetyl-gamma-glutamyl-phosphate reductase
MIKASIIGASGYIGQELVRLLLLHPEVEIVMLTSRQFAGEPVGKVFPWLSGVKELTFSQADLDRIAKESDFVFTALPHKVSMEMVAPLTDRGLRVIDLSADFRFRDLKLYEAWYQEHIAPEIAARSVYGMPELFRAQIKDAALVGNPGCYPTTAILALAPLIKNSLIKTKNIIVDSKSGTSGAGRTPRTDMLFCEVNESFRAYAVGTHRHTPEIEEQLSIVGDCEAQVFFSPHLVPMNRGILSTIYALPAGEVTQDELHGVLSDFYADEPFVRVLEEGRLPNTAFVRGTNYCDISVHYDKRTGHVILLSAIDNLIKGGAGQAVQNFNIMAGINESSGLELPSVYP